MRREDTEDKKGRRQEENREREKTGGEERQGQEKSLERTIPTRGGGLACDNGSGRWRLAAAAWQAMLAAAAAAEKKLGLARRSCLGFRRTPLPLRVPLHSPFLTYINALSRLDKLDSDDSTDCTEATRESTRVHRIYVPEAESTR
ncbi:hypothetical protein BHM03_00012525 [Ensete ventricosum]|nr:hypothetical protein BHM03_00012525 [Ensete ventricosum]